MIKYRKRLLSVAAAAAISASTLGANYIPLTTTAVDNQWVILGVSGLSSDGFAASTPGAFGISDITAHAITDILADGVETAGMGILGSELGYVKAITDGDVEVRVDTTTAPNAVTYLETDPIRTIYIDTAIPADGAPNFAFSYKASLEGKRLEYSVGGGATYYITIDSVHTHSFPAPGNVISGDDEVSGTDVDSLTETNSLVDYDFANNPPLAANWVPANRNVIGGEDLRVYTYDAAESKWNIFDTRNTSGTNDYTKLVAGKGYWAKLDDGDNNPAVSTNEAGFVLGTPNLSTTNYANAGLSEGWNFIAFDAKKPSIRNSTTGMILTTSTTNAGVFTITDSSGNHTLEITGAGPNESNIIVSKRINNAVEDAKLKGNMPDTFELRAYPSSLALQVILISNKKFTVKDTGAELGIASSLTGNPLYNPSTNLVYGGVADVDSTGVMSKYGEYALIVQPLIGASPASARGLDDVTMYVKGATDSTNNAIVLPNLANTVADTVAALSDNEDLSNAGGTQLGLVTAIDLGIDGGAEEILMASVEPFYIRDRTFSRVFTYGAQGANGTIKIEGAGLDDVASIAIDQDGASLVAADIDGTAVSADDDGAGNIVIITDDKDASKFRVLESTADNLQVSSATPDLSLGAVKAVYSLNYFSKLSVRNEIVLDLDEITDAAGETVQIDYTTSYGTPVTGTAVVTADTYDELLATTADNIAVIDAMKAALQAQFTANGITATITDDYDRATLDAGAAAEFDTAVITISGPDVIAASIVYTGAGEVNVVGTPDLGNVATYSPDLATDLKYNPVYTPDYAMDGPLYVMRDNNMTLKALVTGTTDLTDGSVSWESVDLTRKPSEWLDSQDYDLFEVNAKSGYWAYLTPDASDNPLSISSAKLSAEYAHHFDKDISGTPTVYTTSNSFSGVFEIIVEGLSNLDSYQSTRVTATIGGETFELANTTLAPKVFTGTVSAHESYGFSANTNHPVIVNVADGLGNNLSKEYSTDADTADALFDNVKPQAPDVNITDGELSITSTDDSVKGFYVFADVPPEVDTAASAIDHLVGSGTASGGCENIPTASAFDDTEGGIVVLAVDGNGSIGYGNVSDAASVAFMPIMKLRALITNTNNGSVVSSADGDLFDTSCVNTGPVPASTGVSFAAVTSLTTAKLAYTSKGENANNDLPITVYVSDNAGTPSLAKITFPEDYAGTDVFVELNGVVYGYQLPTRVDVDGGEGTSSATPVDLDGLAGANNPKTGIEL